MMHGFLKYLQGETGLELRQRYQMHDHMKMYSKNNPHGKS